MNKKVPAILLYFTLLCIAVYIGVFIGRISTGNITSLPETANHVANNTAPERLLIDLNDATAEDLLALPKIDLQLAQAIIQYRVEFGDYYYIHELKNIEGMTDEIYMQIKDYVTVRP